MQALHHPNITKLIDVAWNADFGRRKGKTRKAIILALELASKGELFNFIATHGAFSETVARTYFRQLVEGVSHMHRDLKPENLLMDQNFMLKIADFGTSTVLEDEEEDYGLLYKEVGTLAYMAPEIFNNQGYNGCAA